MIKEKISNKLWSVIKDNYERESYTSAITNTMIYLNEVIQEKSGLDGLDNIKLVENAFSEKHPKILVTQCVTQSEKNIQKGMGFLLRGLYYAIRHPRAHDRYNDSKETADKIILFADYILSFLEDHQSPELYEDWVDHILDEHFYGSEKSSKDTFDRIPTKKRHDVLIGICRNRADISDGNNIKHILKLLYDSLTNEQFSDIVQDFNKQLKKCVPDDNLKNFFVIFPPEKWIELDVLIRNRVEGMVLKSLEKAEVEIEENDYYGGYAIHECTEVSLLSIWAKEFIPVFSNRDDILKCICRKLIYDNRIGEREFINEHYTSVLKGYNEEEIINELDFYLDISGLEKKSNDYKVLSKYISKEALEKYIIKSIEDDMPF